MTKIPSHLTEYSQLSNYQKEKAQKWHPDDYETWLYYTSGVEIEWCCK